MSYDNVIPLLGDFGRYQKKVYFLLCLPVILCAFHKFVIVFLMAEPSYRCQLPEESSNATYNLPEHELKKWFPYDQLGNKYSSCEIVVENKTKPCDNFVYDTSTFGYTAVVEWELTCQKAYMIATGNAIFMLGVMVGSIGFGEMSDRFGRKLTFFVSLLLQVGFGLAATFSPELWSFSFARFVVGATTSGVSLVAAVLGMEMVGPKKRLITGTVSHMFFTVGIMLVTPLAYYIRNWRMLQLVVTVPGVAFLCYWWFIPESARWLISKHRISEAKEVIHTAAKANGVEIPDKTLDDMFSVSEEDEKNKPKQATIIDAFRYPVLRKRTLVIFFNWAANNLTYYGLSWNTNNLAGDPYLNFLLMAAVEIVAEIIILLTLNRWGRKVIMTGSMMLAGSVLLMTVLIPAEFLWLSITLTMTGKLAISISYGTIYILTAEIFPTVIRNAGLGAASTVARLGSIVVPYVTVLAHIWQPLPLVVFGSVSLCGGFLSFILPETLNRKLPETIEDGENFGKQENETQNVGDTVLNTVKTTNNSTCE